jgi:hypothetical protein
MRWGTFTIKVGVNFLKYSGNFTWFVETELAEIDKIIILYH